jgi:hypothetical protein
MLERLGLVCYWIGSALATLFIIGGIPAALYESHGQWFVFFFFTGLGGLCWLTGRAIKFILSGK